MRVFYRLVSVLGFYYTRHTDLKKKMIKGFFPIDAKKQFPLFYLFKWNLIGMCFLSIDSFELAQEGQKRRDRGGERRRESEKSAVEAKQITNTYTHTTQHSTLTTCVFTRNIEEWVKKKPTNTWWLCTSVIFSECSLFADRKSFTFKITMFFFSPNFCLHKQHARCLVRWQFVARLNGCYFSGFQCNGHQMFDKFKFKSNLLEGTCAPCLRVPLFLVFSFHFSSKIVYSQLMNDTREICLDSSQIHRYCFIRLWTIEQTILFLNDTEATAVWKTDCNCSVSNSKQTQTHKLINNFGIWLLNLDPFFWSYFCLRYTHTHTPTQIVLLISTYLNKQQRNEIVT